MSESIKMLKEPEKTACFSRKDNSLLLKCCRKSKIVVAVAAAIFCLVACHREDKAKNSSGMANIKSDMDAITGATGLGCTTVNISRAEGRKRVYDYLKNSGPYILSTVDGNVPRVRPLGIVMEHDGKIWFHVGKHKASYRQIKDNPNVEIVSVKPKGGWIRISGKAVCEDNAEVDVKTFTQTPDLKKIYNEKSGYTLGHFYISNGIAEISNGAKVERFRF
ncbi:MAG: pyridoxamine 5'-phosphate oxidase family protein [Victivallaceae bacterium]